MGGAAAVAVSLLLVTAAFAYPDAAPWGAANPAAAESCASCHYDFEPVLESTALTLDGLPDRPRPGKSYALTIAFAPESAEASGFQLIATAGRLSAEAPDIESENNASRSTEVRTEDDPLTWQVDWQAPDALNEPIVFYLAASAANHDQSPFGDQIHYRQLERLLHPGDSSKP